MGITWSWKEKIGEIHCNDNNRKINIYKGNCLCVLIKETSDIQYDFYTFFSDEDHLKKCIGLKKVNNILTNLFKDEWESIYLNMYYSEGMKLAKWLLKAGFHVQVYYEVIDEEI